MPSATRLAMSASFASDMPSKVLPSMPGVRAPLLRETFSLDGNGLHQQNLSVEESLLRVLHMPLFAASSFPRSEALSVRSPGLIRMIVHLAAAVPAITPGIWVL